MRNQGKQLKLISPVPCSVNHYIKPRGFICNGKVQVTLYETAEAKKYKKEFSEYVLQQIKEQNFNIIPNKTQHFYVDCIFYFDRIDKDANNYFKLLLDSITETQAIWIDDNVTCERVNAIYYDNKNPRIEINIYPVEYIGIFNSEKDFEDFKFICKKCKKYKEGKCNILKKAIEGRIQEEIIDGVCLKKKGGDKN